MSYIPLIWDTQWHPHPSIRFATYAEAQHFAIDVKLSLVGDSTELHIGVTESSDAPNCQYEGGRLYPPASERHRCPSGHLVLDPKTIN